MIEEITGKETNAAITNLKPNKAPGTHGFPSEWYKEMKYLLIPILKSTLNWVLKEGQIPPSWLQTVISVIPKEGKDRLDCSNYRSVIVLYQDYKIFTRILDKRVEKALPQIISLVQTGFICQRQSRGNIRQTLIITHIITQIQKHD